MDVDRETLRLVGDYVYENPRSGPILAALYTPLPDPLPTDVSLARVESGSVRAIPYLRLASELYWLVRLGPREQARVRLTYRQPLLERQGRYILETTRAWRRPVPYARFTLRLAGIRDEPRMSLDLQERPDTPGHRTWSRTYRDFWPGGDFRFEFLPRRARPANPPGALPAGCSRPPGGE